MKIVNETISRPTFESYYSVLQKIYVIEELEAWPTHLRSTIMLRSSPKRYFVDPSLAVSLLKGTPEKLMNDLNFTGFIFENEVIKNLRIYAQEIGAELYYYGDSYSTLINGVNVVKNREVDVIMALDDGN
jgi:predicted AAA+ superfamily ATPase